MLLFLRIPLSCSVHNLRDLTEMHRVTITKNTVRVCVGIPFPVHVCHVCMHVTEILLNYTSLYQST